MIKNYFIVALRKLFREKVYAFINIFGLAIGLVFCILSFLYVQYEWSFDRFHEKADQIFLIHRAQNSPDDSRPRKQMTTPLPLTNALLQYFSEIEHVVKFYAYGLEDGVYVQYGEKMFAQSGLYVEANVFDVFSFSRIEGDLKTALTDIRSIVVTQEMAELLFGTESPLGKSVAIRSGGGSEDFTVTAVVDVPENSSIVFDFLLSFDKMVQDGGQQSWGGVELLYFCPAC